MSRTRYSTVQVAQMLGMGQANLQRLIRQKRIPFPPLLRVGSVAIRLWTKAQVERARKALAKRRKRRQR
jgi:predicted DNA-binding transcriptional regulator AlpA